jgi:hypothetical protein
VSLEALITTIKQGAGTIQIYRENRTHELRELYSPRIGPHRPSYESVFSKLTDGELEQVKFKKNFIRITKNRGQGSWLSEFSR